MAQASDGRGGQNMRQVACDECGAEIAAGEAVCGRCGASGPVSLADRMAPSPFGPPVARLRASEYGAPALAAAHDTLQPETQARVPASPNQRDGAPGG